MKSLVILAAGLGSRYGGIKQIDQVGPDGQILIDYSITDALRSGFDKLVFIIKHEIEAEFREHIGDRITGVQVEYAFQDTGALPDFYAFPPERKKLLGTVHAMTSATDVIHEPFCIINADDFYGREAFESMSKYLDNAAAGQAAMVAYQLKNTVSSRGSVTRGVCEVASGELTGITETYDIRLCADGTIASYDSEAAGAVMDPETWVSMNFWGFHPSVLAAAWDKLSAFLKGLAPGDVKSEYALPTMVGDMLADGSLNVKMLYTDAEWMGMTYREDKETVQRGLLELHEKGVY